MAPFIGNRVLSNSTLKFCLRCCSVSRARNSSSLPVVRAEHSEEAEYPPLVDLSIEGRRWSKKRSYYESIRKLPTVEEKLRHMGETEKALYIVRDFSDDYNTLPWRLYATKTNLVRGLPPLYEQMEVDHICESLKPRLEIAIANVFGGNVAPKFFDPTYNPWEVDKKEPHLQGRLNHHERMADEVLRLMLTEMGPLYKQVHDIQIDHRPRREAQWNRSGVNCTTTETERKKKYIKERPFLKGYIDPYEYSTLKYQYEDKLFCQLRTSKPLAEFVSRDDPLCAESNVEPYRYHPKTQGLPYTMRHPTTIPGIWPGDSHNFGFLSLIAKSSYETSAGVGVFVDVPDLLDGAGVMSSFSWLLGLAAYKGFTIYDEIPYPFTTQTIITDGKHWSFYAYQLNTVCLGSYVDSNNYCNVCWGTESMKLFDTVEDGRVKGLDERVLRNIVKFFVNKLQEVSTTTENAQLTPFLGECTLTPKEWDINIRQYRHDTSNRKSHKSELKEIPDWKKIYQYKFQTRIWYND